MNIVDQLFKANKTIDHLQAKIDDLMLEYCPDEMSVTQIKEWMNHQSPVEDINLGKV